MSLILPYLFFLGFLIPLKTEDIILENPLPSCKGFTISSTSGVTNKFGYSVYGSGDINDDKIPDIIVSEYRTSGLSTIFVIYGTETGYSDLVVETMTPTQGFRITGLSLSSNDSPNYISAGDVDGDGIADIVIGAGGTSSFLGAVYVIYGKKGGYSDFDISTLTSDKGFQIISPGGRLGWSLNAKVDVNGDKIKDIVVGANTAGTGAKQGAVYVIYGQKARESDLTLATMPASRGFKITGYGTAYVGATIASAGDFNQDSVDDFIVAAPGAGNPQFIGNAYVVYGKNGGLSDFSIATMPAAQGWTLTGETPTQKLALSACDAGDFNNDGVSDIALSSHLAASDSGYAYIFYGKKNGPPNLLTSAVTSSEGFKIQGVSASDMFGSSLVKIPDMNGDGINELLIGAKGFSANKGAVYMIYGRDDQPSTIDLSTLTSDQGFKILGNVNAGLFGSSVGDLGDINQDGFPDMMIGAPGAGRVYVLFGPNAWGCDSCSSTDATCETCEAGYNYTVDGLCYQTCPAKAPYLVDSQCLSELPRGPDEDRERISEELRNAVTVGADVTNTAMKLLNLWSPSAAFPFIYGQLKTSINYMRYMNISRTEALEELYQLYVDTDMSAVPFITMSDSMKDAFPVEPLPYMFLKYELPSSFIANFGDDLMGLAVCFGVFITAKLVEILGKKRIQNIWILRIIHRVSITCENFLVGSFGESVGPILLYTTFEFRNISRGKSYYPLSPLFCCVSLILGICVVILCIWILLKFQTVRKTSSDKNSKEEGFESLEKKYEGVAVLFDEFDDSSFMRQSAFLFFSLKSIAESLALGLLFGHPLAQATLLLLFILPLFIYSISQRAFKSKCSHVQQFILVLSLFICNFCLTIMAGTDRTRHNFWNILEGTSQVIFWILVIFQFIPLIFFGISLYEGAKDLYQWFLKTYSKKKDPNAQNNDQRPSSKLSQVHPSSSGTEKVVLSFNHSGSNLQDVVFSPLLARNSPML